MVSRMLYGKNIKRKVIIIIFFCFILECIEYRFNYQFFVYPQDEELNYHATILTVNSFLSGFSLTNLGILMSISADQLIEKLKGTDILLKRNTVILNSIIFGALSIFVSLAFVVRVDINLKEHVNYFIKNFAFNVEIFSLVISIIYFLVSIKKMSELLSYIYVPKKIFSKSAIEDIRDILDKSVEK